MDFVGAVLLSKRKKVPSTEPTAAQICTFNDLTNKARANGLLQRYLPRIWSDDDFTRISQLIAKARKRALMFYDPFYSSGWSPDENQLSDVLANLLGPGTQNRFGPTILRAILDEVAASHPEKTHQINAALSNSEKFTVRREYPAGISRPDISVFTPYFVIFIENKVSGGVETFIDGRAQTLRQGEVLTNFQADVPLECKLGIFLSPTGASPENKEQYASLSVPRLAQIIRETLAKKFPAILDDPELMLTHAFLWAYENMD